MENVKQTDADPDYTTPTDLSIVAPAARRC